MRKVLQYVPSYNYGGIETFLYNLNRELYDKYRFYYLVETDLDDVTVKKLKSLGADIIRIPNMTKDGLLKHLNGIRKVFKNNKFDIVHVHDCNNRFFVMVEALFHGVKRRIYHIHSQSISGNMLKRFFKKIGLKINLLFSNCCLSCSHEAAKAKGIKKCTVVNNGILAADFEFREGSRDKLRKKYNIPDNAIVLLFVGRVEKIKNVGYLIDIMKEIPAELRDKYYLLIVGDGGELKGVREKAKATDGIKVIFAGSQKDLSSYYSVGDIFCLPSFNEGSPIASLEAQASGLMCLLTENMPKTVNITNLTKFLGIEKTDTGKWVEEILSYTSLDGRRQMYSEIVEHSEFSSSNTAKRMDKIYGGAI